jgi:septum formation protein
MLDSAGVAHEAVPAEIDESVIKARLEEPEQAALELARAKALAVASRRPDEWVIGSDSIGSVDGRSFDKPANRKEAADHLRFFSGKRMRLTSAVALARGGSADWSHVESAELHVRRLSDAFIQAYLNSEWPAVGGCVGVFRMEGRGVHLFEQVEGSHFTILGMPLIPLLTALRERGLLLS